MNRNRTARQQARPSLESLDNRVLLSGATDQALVVAKGGQALGAIYQEFITYETAGSHGTFQPVEANRILFNGTTVGVDVRFTGGDFNTLVSQLKGIGMQVTATSPGTEIVEGYLPIGQLPVVAANGLTTSLSPIYKPVLNNPPPVPNTAADLATVTAKGGQALGSIYGQFVTYQQGGSQGTFTPPEAGRIYLSGNSVGVDIRINPSSFNLVVGQLQGIGFVVTASLPQNGLVEGYLPISQLPVVARNGLVTSLAPIYKPVTNVPTPTPTPTPSPQQAIVAAKGGQALGSIYGQFVAYQRAGSIGTFTPPEAGRIYFAGNSVGVDIRVSPSSFNLVVGQLRALGFVVTSTLPQNGLIEGYLPIAQLPTVASNGLITSLSPVYKPVRF